MKENQIRELKDRHAAKFAAGESNPRKLGIELEFPLVSSREERFGQALSLEEVKKVFRHIGANPSWQLSEQGLDAEMQVSGYKPAMNAEAGFSTLEIALPPATSIAHASVMLGDMAATAIDAATANNAYVLGYGVHPVSPPSLELYSPRDRSNTMRYQRPKLTKIQQDNSDISNTISASVQFHIGARDPQDAINLLNLFNGLAPEFIALSANSRISRGKDSGEIDLRNRFYERYTRYPIIGGVAPKFIDFDEYFRALLDMPLLLLKRDGAYVAITDNMTLGRFIETGSATATVAGQGKPFKIHFETEDVETVESMIRWETRAKGSTGTDEVRTCSMQKSRSEILALGAVVLGLASNMENASVLVNYRSTPEAQKAKEMISKYGILGYPQIERSVKRILDVAKEGLEMIGEETGLLQRFYDRIGSAVTPSDQSFDVYKREGMRPFIESLRFEVD